MARSSPRPAKTKVLNAMPCDAPSKVHGPAGSREMGQIAPRAAWGLVWRAGAASGTAWLTHARSLAAQCTATCCHTCTLVARLACGADSHRRSSRDLQGRLPAMAAATCRGNIQLLFVTKREVGALASVQTVIAGALGPLVWMPAASGVLC